MDNSNPWIYVEPQVAVLGLLRALIRLSAARDSAFVLWGKSDLFVEKMRGKQLLKAL